MTKRIDINEIQQLIPHRFPFLLVDRVLDYTLEKSLTAVKNVTMNELHFMGHFPGQAVMPGVLIVEALAQAGAILAFQTLKECFPERDENVLYLTGVDGARFKRMVVPGDQLILTVDILKTKGPLWKLKGMATVDGKVACQCEIMAALGKN
jgi:3-hydroxyacyl-[acyl-carrier-protein] dehydratase